MDEYIYFVSMIYYRFTTSLLILITTVSFLTQENYDEANIWSEFDCKFIIFKSIDLRKFSVQHSQENWRRCLKLGRFEMVG